MSRPVVLAILDGWGVAPASEGNAVTRANAPNFLKYLKDYPTMTIYAAGNEVGLLFGEMGNSEVGHLNIGAGRVYYQTCPRINKEIAEGGFFENRAFMAAIEKVKQTNGRLHLIGLVSSGNVHSSNEHLYALLELCRRQKLEQTRVAIHVILDGRDCTYNSGKDFVAELNKKMKELKVGVIASVCGRFFAMDRDNRWDRVEKAYKAMASGEAERYSEDPLEAIKISYEQKNFDEEFTPTVIVKNGEPAAPARGGDAAIFFNFRADRARQLTQAFVVPSFNKFPKKPLNDFLFVTMSEYEKETPVLVAYAPQIVPNCLAEVISRAGLKQFHIAETEKYAHVTFFLNGTVEQPFPGEERLLVPSPHVSSYAEVPQMSAVEVAKETIKAIASKKYDFIVVNLANPDMVGHTGVLDAGIRACEVSDKCLGEIADQALAQDGMLLITADHGNVEEMLNLQTGEIDKEHSTNPVPFIVVAKEFLGQAGSSGDAPEGDLSLMHPVGVLADVAPTILKLMGLPQPPEMTGQPLI